MEDGTAQGPSGSVADTNTVLRRVAEPYEHEECDVPSETPQCHASNLLLLRNGELLCAWFGGTQEGKPDISIYMSRLGIESRKWSGPIKMTNDNSKSEQNPVLFQAPLPSEDIWLLYTSQKDKDQDTAIVKRRVSRDLGETWDTPTILFEEPGTFIRQPMVALDNNTWVLPAFKCITQPGVKWVGNYDISCVKASNDGGKTWTETDVPDSYGLVHMAIRRLSDNTYMAVLRSRWADKIYASFSKDGISWAAPTPTTLPNPNSGICFDALKSGEIIIVYNHSSKLDATSKVVDDQTKDPNLERQAFWGAPRAPLCLAWSSDKGNSWTHKVLEDGSGSCEKGKPNRELSYPSITISKDEVVHITFTFWRQKIKYIRLRADSILR